MAIAGRRLSRPAIAFFDERNKMCSDDSPEMCRDSAERDDEQRQQGSWLDQIAGRFQGNEAFKEILSLGKRIRDAETWRDLND
jgi:hypothetical protein